MLFVLCAFVAFLLLCFQAGYKAGRNR